jgi:hypothetical protein
MTVRVTEVELSTSNELVAIAWCVEKINKTRREKTKIKDIYTKIIIKIFHEIQRINFFVKFIEKSISQQMRRIQWVVQLKNIM